MLPCVIKEMPGSVVSGTHGMFEFGIK